MQEWNGFLHWQELLDLFGFSCPESAHGRLEHAVAHPEPPWLFLHLGATTTKDLDHLLVVFSFNGQDFFWIESSAYSHDLFSWNPQPFQKDAFLHACIQQEEALELGHAYLEEWLHRIEQQKK